jgi:hypothetical protein
MGLSVQGLTMRGLSVRGQEFLEPTQIPGCVAWYKWKEGITLDGALKVLGWANQVPASAGGLGNGIAARRPAYNASTGILTPDGVDDYLFVDTSLSFVQPEYTFVMGAPFHATKSTFFGRDRAGGGGADADGLSFRATSAGQLQKDIAVASTTMVRSVTSAFNVSAPAVVFTFRQNGIFVNGVEVIYALRNTASMQAIPPANDGRQHLFSNARNSGGFPGFPTILTPTVCYEWCWHDHHLTTLQRSKLANYFKLKHQID